MVKHIVLLKMKPGTSGETVKRIFDALAALKGKIDGIEDFVWGAYSSDEGLNKGFTHGFIMTFRDARSRDEYLPHPEHEKVKEMILPVVDDVLAFDFEC